MWVKLYCDNQQKFIEVDMMKSLFIFYITLENEKNINKTLYYCKNRLNYFWVIYQWRYRVV